MITFNDVTKENIKKHNPNWSQIPDHLYRILTTGGSESGKINSSISIYWEQNISF